MLANRVAVWEPPVRPGHAHARQRRPAAVPRSPTAGALLLNESDGREVTQAWFQGVNPQLDDRSPARLLREGTL
jgi:hypothetical protein